MGSKLGLGTNVFPCSNLVASVMYGDFMDKKRRHTIPSYLGLDPYIYGPMMYREMCLAHQLHDDRSMMDASQRFSQAMMHLNQINALMQCCEVDSIPRFYVPTVG